MPDINPDKTTATTYPPESLYESWISHADSLNQPISQFIIRMVEAGRKQANIQETTSASSRELRQLNADLERELKRQRTRNEELERQLHNTAQSEIISYIEKNPGATTPELIQRVADTVPGRVAGLLDLLEGEAIELQNDGYYLIESSGNESLSSINESEK